MDRQGPLHRMGEVMAREPWRLDLVRNYSASVERWGLRLDQQYAHEDMVWRAYKGLYVAATTWDPEGKSKFFTWLNWCVKSTTHSVAARHCRHSRGLKCNGGKGKPSPPIHLIRLNEAAFDRRHSYRDR